jgi:hypothetical protein
MQDTNVLSENHNGRTVPISALYEFDKTIREYIIPISKKLDEMYILVCKNMVYDSDRLSIRSIIEQ